MKFIKTITCFFITVAAHHHHKHHHHHLDVLKSNETFFIETNRNIQNTVDEMFNTLDLKQHFLNQTNTKSLLIMQHDLNNIVGSNYKVYNVLKNVSNVDRNAINNIRLDETVKEIFNDRKFNVYHKIYEDERLDKVRSKISTLDVIESNEFDDIMKGFLNKINMLTVDDMFKKEKIKSYFTRRNLKAWQPPLTLKSEESPDNTTDTRRIFRGKPTRIFKFPFIASVHVYEEFMCAGSIISKDLVITAASCLQLHHNNRFFREIPRTTFVRLGSDWTSRLGEIIPILEIYFHPQYDPKILHHNLAIMRLERVLKFQTHRRTKIRRILLDRGDGKLPENTNEIVILGWGSKKANQQVKTFEKLSVAYLNFYPSEECRELYSEDFVTDKHFCAGFLSRGGGACNRDVGGPGIVGGLLVGIVSFGPPVCGTKDAPTVFTRVGPYVDWIETIIEMNPGPARRGTTVTHPRVSRVTRGRSRDVSTPYVIAPIMSIRPPALRVQFGEQSDSLYTAHLRTTTEKPNGFILSNDAMQNYEHLFKSDGASNNQFDQKSLYLRSEMKDPPPLHKKASDLTVEPSTVTPGFKFLSFDTERRKVTLEAAYKQESDISKDNEQYDRLIKEADIENAKFTSVDNLDGKEDFMESFEEKQVTQNEYSDENKEEQEVTVDNVALALDRQLNDAY
ncbi:uncharacterized protein LOC142982858 isoform X2 [Anticarsia gemmatalis]|uniref:uncharacterized protein LOC142982858 isoform X2 n=1 Tax=Anticarsia gemmatalis TaxID=129554 RepID=UPI003F757940